MSKSELTNIRYVRKGDGESTERVVIPTFVPQPNMKALDVTDLAPEQREQLAALYEEYSEYYTLAAKQLFSFDDWLTHTQGEDAQFELKWRTFVLENTEILD